MSLEIKLAWRGKCPVHPKYNPDRQGDGAIRGGCRSCRLLFEVLLLFRQLQKSKLFSAYGRKVEEFEMAADPEGRCRG